MPAIGGVAAPLVDIYPTNLRAEIAALDGWLGPAINNGAALAARH